VTNPPGQEAPGVPQDGVFDQLSAAAECFERSAINARLPWQTILEQLVDVDPDIRAWCVDPSLTPADVPDALEAYFKHLGAPPEGDDGIVVAEDLPTLMTAWSELILSGAGTCVVHLSDDPTVPRQMRLLSLVEEFGVYLITVGSREAEVETTETVPLVETRVGRMKVDIVSAVIEADAGAAQLLGYRSDELRGLNSTAYLHPKDRETAIASWLDLLTAEGNTARLVVRYRRKSGEYFWVEVTHHNRLESRGYIEREFIDFSDRMATILAAERQQKIIDGLADVLPSGIAHFDAELKLTYANRSWQDVTGYDEPEHWRTYLGLIVDPDRETLARELRTRLDESNSFSGEITIVSADGQATRRCRLQVRTLTSDSHGEGWVASLDDVTEAWKLQNRLATQARRDALTGLANRSAIVEELDEALTEAKTSGAGTAVIFLDLNGFKRVNDGLGHSVGDALLQHVGDALTRSTRPDDTPGRHGGDEFIVVCRGLEAPENALRLAQRLLDGVTGRVVADGEVVECSASCGVAFDLGGAHSAERLIAEADQAMYEQKRAGAHDPGLFGEHKLGQQSGELSRDAALRRALTDETLELWYQPIVNIVDRTVVGYEALLRLRLEGRVVTPVDFLGLAERRGLIGDIGAWVLDEVARVAAADSRRDLLWTVNVSPVQLRDPRFDVLVSSALSRHSLEAGQLGLELTDGVFGSESDDVREVLSSVAQTGVELFIEDFGTGHASLNSLRMLPLTGVKIDGLFTRDVDADPRTQQIMTAAVGLAHSLDLQVIVEGIENESQANAVARVGADIGQGYLYGRPILNGHASRRDSSVGETPSESGAAAATATRVDVPAGPPPSRR